MAEIFVQVRKKGQITLPARLRRTLSISEGSELLLIPSGRGILLKPVRKIKVAECSGALGRGDEDELEFAKLDPELLPQYFKKKYA